MAQLPVDNPQVLPPCIALYTSGASLQTLCHFVFEVVLFFLLLLFNNLIIAAKLTAEIIPLHNARQLVVLAKPFSTLEIKYDAS